ncbi:MAG TPA: hypothetical protein VFJ16_00280 [Longimicrobium sp.]|nr:hypothetical protein [Longimicrobium sp.]
MSTVHLHLLLNHVPVIGMVIGLFLLAWAVVRRDQGLARVTLGLFAILAVVVLATFLTGEPAEEAVEGLAGVTEGTIERHEEAALLATIALGVLGALSLGALARFRRRPLPHGVSALLLAVALVPAGAMGWAANLGGQIRHSEIRAGAPVPVSDAQMAGQRGGEEEEGEER